MSKILIIGSNGQLGTELRKLLDAENVPYLAPGSDVLNITDELTVSTYFSKQRPSIVFHLAAYTAVDFAENKEKKLNYEVNAMGTEYVAKASKNVDAILVYISTDYVFDGESTEEYNVDAKLNPRNEYGKAKLAGEQAVHKNCEKHYIVRTSWVFGQYGKNFVYTMLEMADTQKKIRVVADQVGRPTWTRTLSEFILFLYRTNPDYGVYHLSNTGSCSWYDFSREILNDKNIEIQPITSNEYPQIAHRPRHSIMDLRKTQELGFKIPSWKEALSKFLMDINN